MGSLGNPCSQGQDPKSQEHQDTKNDFILERGEDAGTGVPGTPCTEADTFLKENEVFQNPGSLERWKGDKAMRESYWRSAVDRAGVRYRRPYQTRHTYASMILSAGESPMWVAQQSGHSDWGHDQTNLCLTLYWMPERRR